MYRALYVARAMGMEAYGVASDPRTYGGQKMRDLRELLARPKDMLYTCLLYTSKALSGLVLSCIYKVQASVWPPSCFQPPLPWQQALPLVPWQP